MHCSLCLFLYFTLSLSVLQIFAIKVSIVTSSAAKRKISHIYITTVNDQIEPAILSPVFAHLGRKFIFVLISVLTCHINRNTTILMSSSYIKDDTR